MDLIIHKGQKQWPIYKSRFGRPYENEYERMSIRQKKYQEAVEIKQISFIEAMQIAKDFEIAERKNCIIVKKFIWRTKDILYFTEYGVWPNRIGNPTENLEKCNCPVCDGEGCSLCWGSQTTPQNYQGGRE